jgi:hypothetical protein
MHGHGQRKLTMHVVTRVAEAQKLQWTEGLLPPELCTGAKLVVVGRPVLQIHGHDPCLAHMLGARTHGMHNCSCGSCTFVEGKSDRFKVHV